MGKFIHILGQINIYPRIMKYLAILALLLLSTTSGIKVYKSEEPAAAKGGDEKKAPEPEKKEKGPVDKAKTEASAARIEADNAMSKAAKEWEIAKIKTQHAESLEARAMQANVKEET